MSSSVKNSALGASLKLASPFKGISDRILHNTGLASMPAQNEFKTKLRFDPGHLSTALLKRYLFNLLNETDADLLLSGDPPEQYTKDPDNFTNYRVLKELCLMSVRDWKKRLEDNKGDVQILYMDDDMVSQDSRCFYESWKIIQEEVHNHDKIMSFFRLVSEIVSNLSNRNFVEIDDDGDSRTILWDAEKQKEILNVPDAVNAPTSTSGVTYDYLERPPLQPVKIKVNTENPYDFSKVNNEPIFLSTSSKLERIPEPKPEPLVKPVVKQEKEDEIQMVTVEDGKDDEKDDGKEEEDIFGLPPLEEDLVGLPPSEEDLFGVFD